LVNSPRDRTVLLSVGAVMLALLLLAGGVQAFDDGPGERATDPSAPVAPSVPPPSVTPPLAALPTEPAPTESSESLAPPPEPGATLPHGGRKIFEGNRLLVAYYGTGGTGALGVLGESPPAVMHQRLMKAAKPFWQPGQPITPVYELIVTVADATPGPDGDFSHDISRDIVELYVRAAHDQGALLLLDIQPGRSDFKAVAQRWAWALQYPNVGLALDPEWRMQRREVPGQVIGSVTADEVNRTSAWLSRLTAAHDLPEKLFVLHQFRTDMIENISLVRRRYGLALVQHVDGFGTPGQKLATYHAVEHSSKFAMGFKLFYDEDIRRMGPAAVHRIRPYVRFISFQ
jgi:hypothetical protein